VLFLVSTKIEIISEDERFKRKENRIWGMDEWDMKQVIKFDGCWMPDNFFNN